MIYLRGCSFGWEAADHRKNVEKRRLPLRMTCRAVHETVIQFYPPEQVESLDAAALLWTHFERTSAALTDHVIKMHRKIYGE